MTWFIIILVGVLLLASIVSIMIALKSRKSNILLKQKLKKLTKNLYQLKTGYAIDEEAKKSIAELKIKIKGASNDEEAQDTIDTFVSRVSSGLQDYYS